MREIMGVVLTWLNHARRLMAAVLLVPLAALGCHAQSSPQSGPAVQAGVKLSPEIERRIEVMIRNHSELTPDYSIAFGVPTGSEVPGFDQVMITFSGNGSTGKPSPFLISSDGKTLAQFHKFDISGDPRTALSQADRPARGGDETAPVHIVVFDDLECPYCAQMNNELMPAVLKRYKDQVRIVYRDFPLDQLHPWAIHAAVDANCLAAGSSSGYWNYVDYVHAHSGQMGADAKSLADSVKQLDKLALDEGARQGVNQAELVACVLKQDTTKVQASVNTALAEPIHIDPPQAPVIFINGEKIEGIVPVDTLYRIIDRALIAEGRTPPPPAGPAPAAQANLGATHPATTPAPPKPGS